MFGSGVPELILIVVGLLLVFGVGRITDLGGALGKGIKDFKDSVTADSADTESAHEITPGRTEAQDKELAGQLKERAGELTNDRDLEVEGKSDQIEGKVQGTIEHTRDKLRDFTDKV